MQELADRTLNLRGPALQADPVALAVAEGLGGGPTRLEANTVANTMGGGGGHSPLLDALSPGSPTMEIPGLPDPARVVRLGSPELTSGALGAADQTMPGGYILANQKKAIKTFEDAPRMVLRQGKEAFQGGTAEARRMQAIREALAQGFSMNLPERGGFRNPIGL
jgi:hypothetical protein